ncbi:MAG: hypothetical protein KDB90_15105 [Planctomycetes bacterium]|nr:hypothetical protein [Planctomycetota bacterium]
MTNPLIRLAAWIGDWAGQGEVADGTEILFRMQVSSAAEENAVCFHMESWIGEMQLLHGLRLILAPRPDRSLHCMGFSTRFGMVNLTPTPDDEDVLALAGPTTSGMQLSFSLIQQDADTLIATGMARPQDAPPGFTAAGGTHGTLRRVTPWRPPGP